MGVGCNWLQQGFLVCHVWLVFLTSHTSIDVFFCKFFHSSAFIYLAEEVGCVGDARVSRKQVVVVDF